MYTPKHFKLTEEKKIIEFIKKYNFGTIISVSDGRPVATHLPFIVQKKDGKVLLLSHFAKANPQWKDLENQELLIIFSEPHAYISPKNYDKKESVPTWNYIAVHAYGNAKVISEESDVYKLLEDMILSFEESYSQQWNELSEDYRSRMIRGITAFQIEVKEFQAQEKLSQNKSQQEQTRVIHTLSESKNENERLIANYMKENLK